MKNRYFAPPLPSNLLNSVFIVALFILLFAAKDAHAQFMTVYPQNQVLLSSQASIRYAALQDTNHSKSALIVSTQDVRTAQSNGRLTFSLPGSGDTLEAEATLITDDAGGFTWSGKILNNPGYLSFIYENGTVGGFIQVKEHFYEIIPLDNNYQAFIERNNNNARECGSSNPPDPAVTPPGPDYCEYIPAYNTCPALISVLVIVTPEAELWAIQHYGSVKLLMQLAQITVNLAFNNSDIPNKEIRIKWITTKGGFPFSSDYDINTDLSKLPNWAASQRLDNSADLVVLLSNRGYPFAAGAATLNGAPSFNSAFAIVETPEIISNYVFAHEIGHLFGCRHAWTYDYGNDDEGVCAHAIHNIPLNLVSDPEELQYVKGWYTLLGNHFVLDFWTEIERDGQTYNVVFLSDNPILHYSNPDVTYSGVPTGRAAPAAYPANNANQIRNTGCTVADYFYNNDLTFNIQASGCNDPISFTANIASPPPGFAGQGPYTVTWYWSETGLFNVPFQLLGSGPTISLSQHPKCPVYWIKCVVFSSDGVTVSRVRKVVLDACGCYEQRIQASLKPEITKTATSLVYPNPVADGQLQIRNIEKSNQTVLYQIIDISGHVRLEGQVEHRMPDKISLDVSGLDDGFFILRLRDDAGETEILKFIISSQN